jgi:hypothetical protein
LTRRLALIGASCLVALALLDIALRLAPEFPGQRLANATWTRYGRFAGGIYVREPVSGVYFMRPGQRTTNYWNGYRWQHESDARGFRNPAGSPHEVLLLGDSLIYGHGVEEPSTVAHFLRATHGIGAYNMGRQGACLFDEYVYLRTFSAELVPREVLIFVFLNDFDDLEVYRTADEIAAAPETGYDYPAIRAWADDLSRSEPAAPRRWLATLPSLRLLRACAKSVSSLAAPVGLIAPVFAEEGTPPGPRQPSGVLPPGYPPYLAPLLSDERFAAQRDYALRLTADLRSREELAQTRIQWIYLGSGENAAQYRDEQDRAVSLLRELERRFGTPAWDTRGLFDGCSACFLPGDGHFSEEGHRRLARFVAERVLSSPR